MFCQIKSVSCCTHLTWQRLEERLRDKQFSSSQGCTDVAIRRATVSSYYSRCRMCTNRVECCTEFGENKLRNEAQDYHARDHIVSETAFQRPMVWIYDGFCCCEVAFLNGSWRYLFLRIIEIKRPFVYKFTVSNLLYSQSLSVAVLLSLCVVKAVVSFRCYFVF
jgi:hypothetical protein